MKEEVAERGSGREREIREKSGEIVEMFACGTAAVITPIGEFKSKNGTIGNPNAEPGELTVSLRKELTGIQYGTVEDRHNWMFKLSN